MPYQLYDFVSANGRNEMHEWASKLEVAQRAKLNQKLDMLERSGAELRPHLLANSDVPGIDKLKVKGNVQLRPLLCDGPVDVAGEFTLLAGAKEVAFKLVPKGVLQTAAKRKKQVVDDHVNRRIAHVRP